MSHKSSNGEEPLTEPLLIQSSSVHYPSINCNNNNPNLRDNSDQNKDPTTVDNSTSLTMNPSSSFFDSNTKKAPETERVIPLFDPTNNSGTAGDAHTTHYPVNVIVSSRYTAYNFLPKSLLEQFRRLANVYFLVIGMIAVAGEYSSAYDTAVQPQGILGPMLLVILISMIKDGVEDVKRYNQDSQINARAAHKILISSSSEISTIEDVQWRQLHVGDTIVIFCDEEVPADVVVLACGGVQGPTCYVETAAIDGETNLKMKSPCLITQDKDPVGRVEVTGKIAVAGLGHYSDCSITAEPPNGSIHRFNGSLHCRTVSQQQQVDRTLTEKNLLLRGSGLRATEWAICVVVYTGAETKLSLNSKRTPSKLSSVDKIVNHTMVVAIVAMVLVCIVSMGFNIMWLQQERDSDYLCLKSSDLDDRYKLGGGCESGSTSAFLTIFTFATLYNNFVCISMYVSLEMVYLWQSYYLCNDLRLYDPSSDTPAECHMSGMCADLGQVKYVLSDKTGTLTKNLMVVQTFSIADKVFGAVASSSPSSSSAVYSSSPPRTDTKANESSFSNSPLHNKDAKSRISSGLDAIKEPVTGGSSVGGGGGGGSVELERWLRRQFVRVLVYCNTAMLMPDEQGQVRIADAAGLKSCLNAESADEVALILAAAEHCGVLLLSRTADAIESLGMQRYYSSSSSTDGVGKGQGQARERVELLAVNEFDSDRKMMSVLVRMTDSAGPCSASSPSDSTATEAVASRLFLLCKGADSSVLRCCLKDGTEYTTQCMARIDEFASTGLRTLVSACKVVSEEAANQWLQGYRAAANSISNRSELLAACARQIETGMVMVGAIGIEDELQDGVPESIAILHAAHVNVWMITGDKAETGLAIGTKCNLVDLNKQHLLRVVNLTNEALRQSVLSLHSSVMLHAKQLADRKVESSLSSSSSVKSPPKRESGFSVETSPRGSDIEKDEVALLVDGICLEGIWSSDDLKALFVEAVQLIPTVIACRVSPLQKAALVRMIKHSPGKPLTLAIGDGANDVGMIHESGVGVGISGKEGRHAANSADFAISQFSFLIILMFEHGRFNYVRCSKLVLYSFFKNLLLVSILFYYCLYSGFSGTVPLDTIVFSGYNFYLGLPVLVLGAMDWDVPREDILRYPALAYATGKDGEMLNVKNMARWCLLAFFQGLLLFVIAVRIIGGPTKVRKTTGADFVFDIYGTGFNSLDEGWGLGMFSEGFMLFSVAVVAMQLKVASMSVTPTALFWGMIALSLAGYILFTYLYGLFPTLGFYNTVPTTFAHPEFWLAIFIIPFILWLMDYLVDIASTHLDPSSRDKLLALLAATDDHHSINRNSLASHHSKVDSNRDESMGSRDPSDGSKEDEANGGGLKLSTISILH